MTRFNGNGRIPWLSFFVDPGLLLTRSSSRGALDAEQSSREEPSGKCCRGPYRSGYTRRCRETVVFETNLVSE